MKCLGGHYCLSPNDRPGDLKEIVKNCGYYIVNSKLEGSSVCPCFVLNKQRSNGNNARLLKQFYEYAAYSQWLITVPLPATWLHSDTFSCLMTFSGLDLSYGLLKNAVSSCNV